MIIVAESLLSRPSLPLSRNKVEENADAITIITETRRSESEVKRKPVETVDC